MNYEVYIPSYNRPDNPFLKLIKKLPKLQNYVINYVIRKSQYESYYEYVKDVKNVNLIAVEDELINNIGKARNYILDIAKTDCIFMIDDDVCYYNFVENRNGKPKNIKIDNLDNFLFEWQNAMEHGITLNKKISSSCLSNCAWNQLSKYKCDLYFPAGSQAMAVCLNVKLLKEYNIRYIEDVGEDTSLTLQQLNNKLIPMLVCNLSMAFPPMVNGNYAINNMEDRLRAMIKNATDAYGSKYMIIHKSGLNWRFNYNKYCKENNISKQKVFY